MNTRLAIIFPVLLVACMGVATVAMGAHVSDVGAKTRALEIKNSNITAQNEALEIAVAKKLSLTALRDAATAEGYVPRTSFVVIAPTNRLAKAE